LEHLAIETVQVWQESFETMPSVGTWLISFTEALGGCWTQTCAKIPVLSKQNKATTVGGIELHNYVLKGHRTTCLVITP